MSVEIDEQAVIKDLRSRGLGEAADCVILQRRRIAELERINQGKGRVILDCHNRIAALEAENSALLTGEKE